MNKYKKALHNLRQIEQTINTWDISCDVLQELVDRATPKKPKIKKVEYYCGEDPCEQEYEYKCSNCCGWVGNEYHHDKFCASCGQAIDWSNSD